MMDARPEPVANYGAIGGPDDIDPDIDFGFEDIRLYIEDWNAPDFYVQVPPIPKITE